MELECLSPGLINYTRDDNMKQSSARVLTLTYWEGKSKSKGAFKKKHIYCKYTEKKLTTFRRNPPRPVPSFHKFFNSVREKKFFGFVFNQFRTAPNLERIVTADKNLVHHYEPES
jgi:hypothetical protein